MAYLTLRRIDCYVEGCLPRHRCNSAKCAGMCMKQHKLALHNVGGDNISCAVTETCGIVCVRFAVTDTTNHRHIYLKLSGAILTIHRHDKL